jgi:hypothetical protein
MSFQSIKDKLGGFGKSMAISQAPEIAKGFVNELFHQWKIDKDTLIADVLKNASILERMTPEQEKALRGVADLIGNLDFITSEVVIEGIRKDFPLVASLFLGWHEAADWLERQLDSLKQHITTN